MVSIEISDSGAHVSLRNINLNLIPMLQALLKAQSVTGAAATLNLSQSAVSDALSRLREQFGDPLLVRVGISMQLTPFALQLVEPVDEICEEINQLLFRGNFDPKDSEREFVFSCWDYLGLLLAQPLLKMLNAHGPRMSLRFVPDGNDLASRMTNREVDFALIPDFTLDDMAPAPLQFRALLSDTPVVVMASDHPLATNGQITKEDLLAYRQIHFDIPDSPALVRRRRAVGAELRSKVAARTSHMSLIPKLIEGTTHFAVTPALLTGLSIWDQSLVAKKFEFDQGNVTFGMAWSSVLDTDPAHVWFRELIQRTIPPMLEGDPAVKQNAKAC